MNLNEVRVLEACHKFLIGLTEFEEKLQNDSLVFLSCYHKPILNRLLKIIQMPKKIILVTSSVISKQRNHIQFICSQKMLILN